MNQADRIRQYVLETYILPARSQGQERVTLRAGDIHQALGLSNALPAVCASIGSNKFSALAQITLVDRTGPANGSNVYFSFKLNQTPPASSPTKYRSDLASKRIRPHDSIDLAGALVLVSCVKSKLPHPAPARLLYTSPWFTKVRDLVERQGARWLVLSSKYGLVEPDLEIAPYDYTLNSLGVRDRSSWANTVLPQLLAVAAGYPRVIMFAGARYRENLIGPLRSKGIAVDVPMLSLSRGKQLAWLGQFR